MFGILENIFLQTDGGLDPTVGIFVSVSAAAAAVVIIFVTLYYERQNLQFNMFQHIFQILGDEKNRNSREEIYRRWEKECIELKNYGLFEEPDFKNKAELVATTFDEIGIFIYKKIDLKTRKKPWRFRGFLKKEFFLTAYSGAVVNSWVTLNEFIKRQREERGTKFYQVYFEKLYEDAVEFRRKNKLGKTRIQGLAEKTGRI